MDKSNAVQIGQILIIESVNLLLITKRTDEGEGGVEDYLILSPLINHVIKDTQTRACKKTQDQQQLMLHQITPKGRRPALGG